MAVMLETKRLIIQVPDMHDLENYIKLHMDPEVRRLMYTRAKDVDEIKSWLEASIAHYEKFGFSVGSVYEKVSGNFIGRAGLLHLCGDFANPEVEIDCYLFKPYWRKRYGIELLQAFFQWGFSYLNLEKILATVYPINLSAKHLAESAGMQYIGTKAYLNVDFLWYEIKKPMASVCKAEQT